MPREAAKARSRLFSAARRLFCVLSSRAEKAAKEVFTAPSSFRISPDCRSTASVRKPSWKLLSSAERLEGPASRMRKSRCSAKGRSAAAR